MGALNVNEMKFRRTYKLLSYSLRMHKRDFRQHSIVVRKAEKRRVQTSNRLGQVENEIRLLCEKALPFSLFGKFFDNIREQIEKEREPIRL